MLTKSFCSNLNSREQACLNAVSKWKRTELLNRWMESLTPSFLHTKGRSIPVVVLGVIFLPLLVLKFITHIFWETVSLPFSIAATYFSPMNIDGIGERNLQGIHHRLVPYMSLSPQYYMYCVNDWVEILYGEPQAVRHSIREFIDPSMVENMHSLYGDNSDAHARHILADAREKLSRHLGNY